MQRNLKESATNQYQQNSQWNYRANNQRRFRSEQKIAQNQHDQRGRNNALHQAIEFLFDKVGFVENDLEGNFLWQIFLE